MARHHLFNTLCGIGFLFSSREFRRVFRRCRPLRCNIISADSKSYKPKHFPAGFRKTPVNPRSIRDPATATIKTLQITDRNADAPKVTTVTNTGESRTDFKLKKNQTDKGPIDGNTCVEG